AANNGNSGGDGGGFSDMAAGGSDMGTGCAVVQVTATDPGSGATTDHVPARLVAVAMTAGARGPHWSLTRAGDSASVTPVATDSTGLRVQYDVTEPGTWTFTVDFDSGPCRGMAGLTLGNPVGAQQLFRLRALPPETSGFPLTDIPITVTGGTPLVRDLT